MAEYASRAVPVPTNVIIAYRSPDTFYDEKGKLLMHHRRHLALLGSILFAVSMLFALTPAASTAFADTVTPDSVSAGTPAQSKIICRASISATPFLAGNEAQGVGAITCTAPVSALSITTSLFRDKVLVAHAHTLLAFKNYIFSIPKYTCTTATHFHNFYAAMVGTVHFPPGYSPPSGAVAKVSGVISLAC